jgi:mannose-6-phosphate isomerase
MSGATPQLLPPNQVEHFYRGGDRITALRGGSFGLYRPEEWIGSVTTMAGQEALGLSRLADGTLLRDAIAADPEGWLGRAHLDSYGTSTELLVKLLDAGERLPVHVHPDRAFAMRHWKALAGTDSDHLAPTPEHNLHRSGLPHGKTEAWVVLEADEGARVRLGFAESMRLADVRAMAEAQDTEALVDALRAHPVRPGDAVLVPAGLPHCIDAGLLVLELQEPTDLSILLEWSGFAVDGREHGHLGLGFDLAYQALRLDALDSTELDRLVVDGEQVKGVDLASLMPAAADPYFRAHQLRSTQASGSIEAGFAVVLVTRGSGHLVTEAGDRLEVRRGNAVVVPFRAGVWHLEGELDGVLCRPPLPTPAGTPG